MKDLASHWGDFHVDVQCGDCETVVKGNVAFKKHRELLHSTVPVVELGVLKCTIIAMAFNFAMLLL